MRNFLDVTLVVLIVGSGTKIRSTLRRSSELNLQTGSGRSSSPVLIFRLRERGPQGFSMAKVKPLISDDPKPESVQFSHFGVLNDGNQSKSSLFTSIALNVLLAFCAVVIGAAAKKTIDNRHKLTSLTEPIPIKKAEEPPPPKIKIKIPPPPPMVKVEPPKIKIPEVKLPDVPKPPEIKMAQPMPVVLPAPPKLVQAPPAP